MMIVLLAMIAQFKEGDLVYLKSDPTKGWITSALASARYQPSYGGSLSGAASAFDANVNAGSSTAIVVHWPKYTRLKVLTTIKTNGDTLVRALQDDWKESYWFHADELGAWTDEIEKKKADDKEYGRRVELTNAMIDKLKPYVTTKTENLAVNSALAKGLNPLTMTAKEASVLTASERRALSAVRQRYRKGIKP